MKNIEEPWQYKCNQMEDAGIYHNSEAPYDTTILASGRMCSKSRHVATRATRHYLAWAATHAQEARRREQTFPTTWAKNEELRKATDKTDHVPRRLSWNGARRD